MKHNDDFFIFDFYSSTLSQFLLLIGKRRKLKLHIQKKQKLKFKQVLLLSIERVICTIDAYAD